MAINVVWRQRQFICQFIGDISSEHLFSALKSFYHDSKSSEANSILIDFSAVRSIVTHDELLADIVKMDAKNSLILNHIYFAFVEGKGEAEVFIEKYLEMANKANIPWTYQCFADLNSAIEWSAEETMQA